MIKDMTEEKANFEIALWNADAETTKSRDLYLWLRESGLPDEVVVRLKNICDFTVKTADRIISIGKIILIKVIEFVKEHPNLAIGVAVGVALGLLSSMIPFLGPYLAPIVGILGVTFGAVAGNRKDRQDKGQLVNTEANVITISEDIIDIARDFFKMLIDIFNTLFNAPVIQGA